MSMLSESRRRSKWAFNPRGLKNGGEHEKKGKSLLEKMGWAEGQGLGKANQGRLDPITLKVKNDAKGVGFEGRSEAVLAHQDDFQSLLEDLAKSHENSAVNSASNSTNVSGDEDNIPAQVNNPEKESAFSDKGLKRDRKRYHKSRGAKDATKYSHKDLEGIVGSSAKKSKVDVPNIETNIPEVHANTSDIDINDEMSIRPSFSLATPTVNDVANDLVANEAENKKFSYGGDLNAYFARKMEEKKSGANNSTQTSSENTEHDAIKSKKSKKKKKESKIMNSGEPPSPLVAKEEQSPNETDREAKDKFTNGGDLKAYFARKMEEKKLLQINAPNKAETEDASKEPTEHKKSKKAKKAKKATEDIDEKKNSNIQSVETNDPIHNLTDQQASLDRKMKKKLEKEIEGGSNLQSSQKESKKHKKHKKASKDMEDNVKSSTEEERSKQIEQTCMANSVNTVHESETKLQLSATIEINKSIEKSNMDAVAKELTKPKKSKKAKKSSKNKEKEEPEQSKKRKADTEEIMEDSIKCDSNKKKKSKKDKENKNEVINESETHNNLIAGEKDRKKKENLKINGKYDDIIGFKGTNVLSIKGYGVK